MLITHFPRVVAHICALMTLMYVKIPTNALTYVNTTLFTLLLSYMFQSSRGHPEGLLIHFVSRVNKIHVPDVRIRLKNRVLYVTWQCSLYILPRNT